MTNDIIQVDSKKGFQSDNHKEWNEEWTTECSVDQLFLNLVKIKETVANCGNRNVTVWKYYRQARLLMKWIPIKRLPSNEFVIHISDLSPRVKADIESITHTPETLSYIVIQAVGRIFENLDFDYYHQSISRNLRVRLEA